jgi:hypothetical protein
MTIEEPAAPTPQAAPPPETCGNCRYFIAQPPEKTSGMCRRYPPTVPGDALRWPSVYAVHWCGEWKNVAVVQALPVVGAQLDPPPPYPSPSGPE